MSTITFDTHQLVKELESKGFSPAQAEGINDALKNAMTVAEVATSRDIRDLEQKMKGVEVRLTMKIGTLIVASMAFLTALQKLM